MLVVVLGTVLGVAAASDGFTGTGPPTGAVPPQHLAVGQVSTVEYCRPHGAPLAMDVYIPTAAAPRPAPVVLYVHGGGLMIGDRKTAGLGAALADNAGALFGPLQHRLTARGFVVASIDYRLAPAAPWPAQIQDVKCAVRFLRAHSYALGIDPARIGAWGSSAGGQLVSLLGTTGQAAGFDTGEYRNQSSAVQAVVDMFGPADLNNFNDASPFGRPILWLTLGSSIATRSSASPDTYVAPGAPPFMMLQGTEDPMVKSHQTAEFAARLHAVGASVTLLQVRGAGHQLDTSAQHPTPGELTDTVVAFLTRTLRRTTGD